MKQTIEEKSIWIANKLWDASGVCNDTPHGMIRDYIARGIRYYVNNQNLKHISELKYDKETCEEICKIQDCTMNKLIVHDICIEITMSHKLYDRHYSLLIYNGGGMQWSASSTVYNCGQIWKLIFDSGYEIQKG